MSSLELCSPKFILNDHHIFLSGFCHELCETMELTRAYSILCWFDFGMFYTRITKIQLIIPNCAVVLGQTNYIRNRVICWLTRLYALSIWKCPDLCPNVVTELSCPESLLKPIRWGTNSSDNELAYESRGSFLFARKSKRILRIILVLPSKPVPNLLWTVSIDNI